MLVSIIILDKILDGKYWAIDPEKECLFRIRWHFTWTQPNPDFKRKNHHKKYTRMLAEITQADREREKESVRMRERGCYMENERQKS